MIGQEQEPEVGYKCGVVDEVEVEKCDEGTMEGTNQFIAGIDGGSEYLFRLVTRTVLTTRSLGTD